MISQQKSHDSGLLIGWCSIVYWWRCLKKKKKDIREAFSTDMICSRPSPHWWCRGLFSCSKLMADIFMWPRPSADVIKGALIWFRSANHLPTALMSPVSMIYFLLSVPTLFPDPDIYFVKILAVILCWSMESSLESWLRWVWMVFTQSSNFSVSMSKAKTDHNESKWHLQINSFYYDQSTTGCCLDGWSHHHVTEVLGKCLSLTLFCLFTCGLHI